MRNNNDRDIMMYLDEIKLRLSRFGVAMMLDDITLIGFINKARREIQRLSVGMFPERYGKIAILEFDQSLRFPDVYTDPSLKGSSQIYAAKLPEGTMDVVTASVRFTFTTGGQNIPPRWKDGDVYNMQARRTTKQEVFGIVSQSFGRPNIDNPIYCIETKTNDERQITSFNEGDTLIYVAGLYFTNTLGEIKSLFELVDPVLLDVWYISALNDLEDLPAYDYTANCDIEYRIPPQFDEFIIYEVLLYCAQKMQLKDVIQSLYISKKQSLGTLDKMFIDYTNSMANSLPSKEKIGGK